MPNPTSQKTGRSGEKFVKILEYIKWKIEPADVFS